MLEEVTLWGEATLAMAGVVAVLGAAVKKIYRMARNIEAVLAEVRPNGGGSLKDAVTRIENQVALLSRKQDDQSAEIAALRALPCRNGQEC